MTAKMLLALTIWAVVAHASAQSPGTGILEERLFGPGSDPETQVQLAEAFHFGLGTRRNLSAAFEWYAIAADQGHVEAQNVLGMFYMGGLGVAEDCRSALYWFERAAAAGNVDALNNAAWVLATCPDERYRDGRRAIELVSAAIEKNGPQAAFQGTLAAAYAETGDFIQAIELIQYAIESMLEEGKLEAAAESEVVLERFRNGQPWRGALFIDPEDYRH
ncbi:MAG TPA: tetratricopeptide repeat protein [Xanthomonadaceae bacterium]|nr:tetratricopeptide repeat protein [Xanthomonadaceae bacterium]